jgi:hypothetical protein
MLPAYESLYWTLQNLKGKDDVEATKIAKARTLLSSFEPLSRRLEDKRCS